MFIDKKFFLNTYNKILENDGYGGILIFVDGAKSCYELKDSLLNSNLFNDSELLILYSNMEEKSKKDSH